MRGQVLAFNPQTSTGIISGEDGNRYSFAGIDVPQHFNAIREGAEVDFTPVNNGASDIYVTKAAHVGMGSGPKEKIVAALLAFFLGGLGIHKFYLGKKNAGVIMLVVSIGGAILFLIPTMIIGLIAFIEAVIYLVKSEDEFQRDYVDGDKSWF